MLVVFARVLQGVLAVIIVTVLVIAALQLRRTNLLYVESRSLAGLGTLVADWEELRLGSGMSTPVEDLTYKNSEDGN